VYFLLKLVPATEYLVNLNHCAKIDQIPCVTPMPYITKVTNIL
jgi:hypothetical protein